MFVKERNKNSLPSNGIKVKIALVYPNLYEMGMSSYTIHLLYSLFNNYPGIRCERFFLPRKKDIHVKMQSIDTGSKLENFDVIAFSVHYELDYTNILWVLDTLHIPLLQKDRDFGDYPLIIAGGSAVKSNPLILLPFIDLLEFGDIEPIFNEFCDLLVNWGERNMYFNQILNSESGELDRFCALPNFLISKVALDVLNDEKPVRCPYPVKRKFLLNLDESSNPTRQIIPVFKNPDKSLVFGETFLLEINRGCPSGCRFCLTGYVNRPFRNRSLEEIKHIIDLSVDQTTSKKITLIGSAVASHPNFLEICQYIVDKNLQIMIPSIRIDLITPEILKVLKSGGIKSLTIAPETGTDLLRKKLNKSIENTEIIDKCIQIFQFGFQSIKFYFLLGLPYETDEDIQAIPDLINSIIEKKDVQIQKKGIRLSINPFIPKFFTPYRDYTHHFLSQKMEYFKNAERMIRVKLGNSSLVNIEFLYWKEARLQTILSQIDHTFAPIVVEFYKNGSLPVIMNRLDKENNFIITNYLKATSNSFLNGKSNQTIALKKIMDIGFIENYLNNELKLSQMGKITGCGDNCHRCGLC